MKKLFVLLFVLISVLAFSSCDMIKGEKGDKGAAGSDGVSIIDMTINGNYELIVTYSDGTVDNLGALPKGEKGDMGEQGPMGPTGCQGLSGVDGHDGRGIENMEIVDRELIVTYTDGTVANLGVIVGYDGKDGEDLDDCAEHVWESFILYNHYLLPSGEVTLGVTLKVCTVCGDAALVKVGCEFKAIFTEPTCVSDGYTTYVCSCGFSYVDDVIPAYGHSINNDCEYYVVPPTADVAGEAHITCAYCYEVLAVVLPPLGDETYEIDYGNCFRENDIYTIEVEYIGTKMDVTFEINGDYDHDEAPAKDECVITEGDNFIYYSYLCSKCNSWVIAYVENK